MRSTRSSNDSARVPDPSILTPPAGQSGDLGAPPSLNVGQHRGGYALVGDDLPERRHHDPAGHPAVTGDRERVMGMIIEKGQDLGIVSEAAVGSGEPDSG
jgi:hypothetical protein